MRTPSSPFPCSPGELSPRGGQEPLRVSAGGSVRFAVDRGLLEEHARSLGLALVASGLLEDRPATAPSGHPPFLALLGLETQAQLSEELERAHATGRAIRTLVLAQQRASELGEADRHLHYAEAIVSDWRSRLPAVRERRAEALERGLQQVGLACNREGFSAPLVGELDRAAATVRAWDNSHRQALVRLQDRERRLEEQAESEFVAGRPSPAVSWEGLLLAVERDVLEAVIETLGGLLETIESIVAAGTRTSGKLSEIRDSAALRAERCVSAAHGRCTPGVETLVSARLVELAPGGMDADYAKAALRRAAATLGRSAFSDVIRAGFDEPLVNALQAEVSADLRDRLAQPVATIWLSRFRDVAGAREAIHDLAARCGSGRRRVPDARVRLHGRLVVDAASAALFERHLAGQLPPGWQIDDTGSAESFVVWVEELNVPVSHLQVLEEAMAAAEALRSDRDRTPFLPMLADLDLAAPVEAPPPGGGAETAEFSIEEN